MYTKQVTKYSRISQVHMEGDHVVDASTILRVLMGCHGFALTFEFHVCRSNHALFAPLPSV